MFQKLKKLKKHYQLAYSLIIVIAVVGIWRGVWMLTDIYLFPKNDTVSAMASLVIGVIILTVTHHRLS